jgi:transcriptional regulator with PAS, ATPase and Fis domain
MTTAAAPVRLDSYISNDASMRSSLELARVASRADIPVLILGESGTGKTLLARAIHDASPRATFPFLAFHAAALSDTLLDSQLFGHKRGAFTGATQRVKGKFELADRGTLFIDEIADMSLAAQAKILRAVEYGEFEPLGSETLQTASVRVISATHWSLKKFMETETFRRDLFYRISGITINIPPLRERPNDLRALVKTEVASAARAQGKTISGVSKEALERLYAHHWPGNLRELARVIQTAVAVSEESMIGARDIILDAFVPAGPSTAEGCDLRTAERRHIEHVLQLASGNKRRAARLLGVSRSTLDRKLEDVASKDSRSP